MKYGVLSKIADSRFLWLLIYVPALAFEVIYAGKVISNAGDAAASLTTYFTLFLLIQTGCFVFFKLILGKRFELEIAAFMLSFLSIAITASVYPKRTLVQFLTFALGVVLYYTMLWILQNTRWITSLRVPAALGAVGLLAATIVFGTTYRGARNWIFIGDFSIQPSELAKILFIFVGAVTLDKLQSIRSLSKYILFAACCIGIIFVMKDFGTALIFFATFLIISFMRSGDIKKILLICAAAAVGAVAIVIFKPYVANRFMTYRHIWDYMDSGGYQQTRVLIYSASGGLFGVGLGNGQLRNVFAATEDLVFGVLCEEFGIILAFTVALTYVAFAFYSIKMAKTARSTFYSIAACAAAGLMLFQAGLNIFGVTDLLPLTGVTLPFVSRGGSSMLSSWGLLAYLKAVDPLTYPVKKLSPRPAPVPTAAKSEYADYLGDGYDDVFIERKKAPRTGIYISAAKKERQAARPAQSRQTAGKSASGKGRNTNKGRRTK